jgi:hypothetical protein
MSGTLKRATGNWVVGDQFWDRETELELFIRHIDEGAHLLVVAQRRIGKTSLMKEAARRLSDRYTCLFVDLQKAHTPADAIIELSIAARPFAPLWEKTKSVFQNVLKDTIESIRLDELTVTLRNGITAGDWQPKGDRLFEIIGEHERPVLLLLDELPILVNRLLKGNDYTITPDRRQTTDAFLSWLRFNGIRHQGQVRIVVAGSIGLEPVVRQAGLSAALNTFTPFTLRPWNQEVAAGCLRALAAGYGLRLPESIIADMLGRLGICIPHHVQMFFNHIYEAACMQHTDEITAEMVAEVYAHSMLGIRGHVELSQMEERLEMVLGPVLAVLALDLLTESAVAGSLTEEAAHMIGREHFPGQWRERLQDVLGIMEHDGYVTNRRGEYVFESGLLRDWWKARFGFGYVPVAKRGR